MVSVRFSEPSEAIAQFYRDNDYAGNLSRSDRIIVAEQRGALVGLFRLVREHGVLVLRGMRVHPSVQRQGIGRRLLEPLSSLDEACYCVPHAHLEGFYGRAGFAQLVEEDTPPFLQSRLGEYRARGLQVLLMKRDPA